MIIAGRSDVQALTYRSPVAGEIATPAIKTGAGRLKNLRVTNFSAGVLWIFVFDSVSASGPLVTPPIPIAVNSQYDGAWFTQLPFLTGLVIGASTTPAVYTAAAAAAMHVHATYA
jgi:hypothetical protein